MTGMLTDRVKETGMARVKAVAKRIAKESPGLADLSAEDLEKLARVVVAEGLKDELKQAAKLEKIDLAWERENFLKTGSKTRSKETERAYRTALDHLSAWCAREGLDMLELTPARADDWINAERVAGGSPSSVLLRIAGASSFWTYLERRHSEIRNPFRGTRARPPRKTTRKLAVPSDLEIREIEAAAKPELRAAIVMMSQAGLRVGGLQELSINGTRWTTTSKGKEHSGTVPQEAREAITKAGLPLRSPFGETNAGRISHAFGYLSAKLHAEGKLAAVYSVHNLRHAYAVRVYQSTHDIYAVEQALGHANVSVTEVYLKSLGLRG